MLSRTAHQARFSVTGEYLTALVAHKTCCHCTLLHTVTTNHYCILLRHTSTYFYCLISNTGTSHYYIPPQLHYTTAHYYVLPRHLQATTAQCQILQLHATEVIHRCERGLRRGPEATLGNIPVPEAAWEHAFVPVRLGGIGLRSPSTIQSAACWLASLVRTRERALVLGTSPEHLRDDFGAALGDMSPNCSGIAIFNRWISYSDLGM